MAFWWNPADIPDADGPIEQTAKQPEAQVTGLRLLANSAPIPTAWNP
jgi:hypothetical protein